MGSRETALADVVLANFRAWSDSRSAACRLPRLRSGNCGPTACFQGAQELYFYWLDGATPEEGYPVGDSRAACPAWQILPNGRAAGPSFPECRT